ncbi:MAG: non-canonical purine NTP diphosphatase [Flavobacteriales bacterium]
MALVFATNNHNKLKEVISKLKIDILGLADIQCTEDIDETGKTFEENALIKAKYVLEKYGYDCFADDSGLEVEALGGAPGVYSARYAGEHGNAEANMNKLLENLKGIDNRKARFVTVICLINKEKTVYFRGEINGTIINEKRGSDGFGYDPIFVPDGYSRTFAEMTLEEKNKMSHRALAVEKMVNYLNA